MVLSTRERYVVIGTAVVVGALALDQFVLSPLLRGRSRAEMERRTLLARMGRAQTTLKHSQALLPKWREMVAAGVKADPAEAESQVLHAIRDGVVEAGVTLSMLRPERLTDKTQLPGIAFQATGTGSMEAISRLLWRVEHVKIPMRITEVQLASRKEGTNDLTVQVRLSTLYLPAPARPEARPAPAARRGEP